MEWIVGGLILYGVAKRTLHNPVQFSALTDAIKNSSNRSSDFVLRVRDDVSDLARYGIHWDYVMNNGKLKPTLLDGDHPSFPVNHAFESELFSTKNMNSRDIFEFKTQQTAPPGQFVGGTASTTRLLAGN